MQIKPVSAHIPYEHQKGFDASSYLSSSAAILFAFLPTPSTFAPLDVARAPDYGGRVL